MNNKFLKQKITHCWEKNGEKEETDAFYQTASCRGLQNICLTQ